MKNLLYPFKEPDGSFSWRKTGTALCFLVFTVSALGYEALEWRKLPPEYIAIITMVFTFYFLKDRMSRKENK